MKRGDTTTGTTEIQMIIRGYYQIIIYQQIIQTITNGNILRNIQPTTIEPERKQKV